MSKSQGSTRIRLLATREEIIESKLTQLQLEDKRSTVMELLNEEESIEAKKDEASKNFASQLKTNRLQIDELRRIINSGRERTTIQVEEYLTKANEVIRIRTDTGDQIGQRTASQRELQEDLPLEQKVKPEGDEEEVSAIDDAEEFGVIP